MFPIIFKLFWRYRNLLCLAYSLKTSPNVFSPSTAPEKFREHLQYISRTIVSLYNLKSMFRVWRSSSICITQYNLPSLQKYGLVLFKYLYHTLINISYFNDIVNISCIFTSKKNILRQYSIKYCCFFSEVPTISLR